MIEIIAELKENLIFILQRLSRNVERIFINLAENYPILLDEMNRSLEESNKIVDGFQSKEGRAGLIETQIGSTIEKTKIRIAKASSSFNEIHSQDDILFNQLNSNFQYIASLEKIIIDIIEDSKKMDLISINAMTVALKSGKEGGAFSYITEELKRLASKTIESTSQLTQRGEHLQKLFQDFKNSMKHVQTFQQNLFNSFYNRINESFKDFTHGVNTILNSLVEINSNSNSVKEPLFKIMQEIQNQDIIRQSINHVIISIEEVAQYGDDVSEEILLDELSFLNILPDLCKRVLYDVSTKIKQSLKIFYKNTNIVRNTISNVEINRQRINSSFVEAEYDEEHSLYWLFKNSSDTLKELINDIRHSMHLKEKVNNESRFLMKQIKELEDGFKAFSMIIGRFNNINVASRIEVSKQEVLKDMKSTVKEMTGISSNIEENVNEALKITKKFIKGTYSTIREYDNIFQEEEIFVDNFIYNINKEYKKLFDAKSLLEKKFTGFAVFTSKFFSIFQSTSRDLLSMETILEDIDDIYSKLYEIKEKASDKINTILKSREEKKWTIHNQKLKQIIDRFTIFTHKKTIGHLSGIDVEQGTPEGELTLF